MNTYNPTKAKPYVYICTNKISGHFYIGYREANVKLNRTSDIDFPIYRSSSKAVKDNFDNFEWTIVAEFETGKDAYAFEQKLIHEHWDEPLLLNEHCCHNDNQFRRSAPPWNKGRTGLYSRTDDTKQKIKQKRALQVMGDSPLKGKSYAEIHGEDAGGLKKKISEKMLSAGIKRTEEFKENLRKPKEKVTCPHCGKVGGGGSMVQWHFDNCKNRNDL